MKHFIGCDVHTRNQVVAWVEEERSSAELFFSEKIHSALRDGKLQSS